MIEIRRKVMNFRGSKNLKQVSSTVVLAVIVSLMIGLIGCGSSSNDQGVAFTFLGYFQEAGDGSGEIPEALVGLSAPLSNTINQEGNPALHGGALTAYVGLQNNLSGQFIRAKRIYFSYSIAGAAINPPDTSLPLSGVISPMGQEEGGTDEEGTDSTGSSQGSSLPDTFTGGDSGGPRYYAQTLLVPPAVMSWLSFNRDSLPEPPFTMVVTSQIEGITSGADVLRTNREDIFINFLPDNFIPPVPAEGDGAAGSEETAASTSDGDAAVTSEEMGIDLWADIARQTTGSK